jgi:hypothetical protein
MKENTEMPKTKYGKHIIRNAAKKIKDFKGNTKAAILSHEGELKTECSIGYHGISEPIDMPTPPHSHDCHQLLCFIGGNPQNLADFGAEVELCLGEEQEKHLINTTSIVSIPEGLKHCPLNFKKVDKPIIFLEITLERKYEKVMPEKQA